MGGGRLWEIRPAYWVKILPRSLAYDNCRDVRDPIFSMFYLCNKSNSRKIWYFSLTNFHLLYYYVYMYVYAMHISRNAIKVVGAA